MESSNILNPAVRVKNEPLDDYDYKIINRIPVTQNIKYERIWQGNSDQMIQKYVENHENELDDLQIEIECSDMKPNLLAVAKIEDCSKNQQDSDEYKTGNKVKLENVGAVKKEMLNEEVFDSAHIGITPACDNSGKSSRQKTHLKVHIDTVHKDVTHACEIWGNVFKRRGYLKKHIDSVHNGVSYACDVCGKTFNRKDLLKRHIDSVHHKIKHPLHNVNKLSHNGTTYSCATCGKTFGQKKNLKAHIDTAHKSRIQIC
ncbi:hypothetical protein TKK_0004716 [Trichogramma kaykai]